METFRRILHEERRTQYREEIGAAKDTERGGKSHRRDQPLRYRRSDESPTAKPSHGQASNHAAFIGKPFDECRYRNNVTKPQTKAAQNSKTKIEQSQVPARLPSQYHTQPVTKTADHCQS